MGTLTQEQKAKWETVMVEEEMRYRTSPQALLYEPESAVAKWDVIQGVMISAKSLGGQTQGNGESADVIQGTAGQNNMISHAHYMKHESIWTATEIRKPAWTVYNCQHQ